MTEDQEIPFFVHEADRKPADLTDPKSTASIILGVLFGSFLAAAAAWFWLA